MTKVTPRNLLSGEEQISNNFEKDVQYLLSCLWTDAHMAIDESWDKSNDGFEAQISIIERFASKYKIEIKDVRKDD